MHFRRDSQCKRCGVSTDIPPCQPAVGRRNPSFGDTPTAKVPHESAAEARKTEGYKKRRRGGEDEWGSPAAVTACANAETLWSPLCRGRAGEGRLPALPRLTIRHVVGPTWTDDAGHRVFNSAKKILRQYLPPSASSTPQRLAPTHTFRSKGAWQRVGQLAGPLMHLPAHSR